MDEPYTLRIEGCAAGWQIFLTEAGADRSLGTFPDRWRAAQYARAQIDQLISRGALAALETNGPGRRPWG